MEGEKMGSGGAVLLEGGVALGGGGIIIKLDNEWDA